MPDPNEQLALEKYKLLLGLWQSENPIKTNKLQVLLATNAVLVPAYFLADRTPWTALVGFLFSLVWTLSIGRTVAFQRHWRGQMEELRKQYSNNIVFQIHNQPVTAPIWGRVHSSLYLIGTPIATAVGWLAVLLYTLFA